MVSYGDARKWQPEPLDEAERQIKARSDTPVGLADEVTAAANPPGWHGAAAEQAAAEVAQTTDQMEHVLAGLSAARAGLMHAADRVTELKHYVADTDGLARAQRFTTMGNGEIGDAGPSPGTPPDQVDAVRQERSRTGAELTDRVHQIVKYANDIDATLAKVIEDVEQGRISDGGATTRADAAKAGETKAGLPGPPPDPATDPGAGEHGSDPWYSRGDDWRCGTKPTFSTGTTGTVASRPTSARSRSPTRRWPNCTVRAWHRSTTSGDQRETSTTTGPCRRPANSRTCPSRRTAGTVAEPIRGVDLRSYCRC
ncbi:hypothetical protein [Kibdelosporangium phytohabitans]|uniref:ESX-1 secretion-associated protein EspA/EspE-like domain-containing protein n=1 Tax=Kibdelosporangium phytohabitans TaxID=860235 RepID=A0A0N7F315_9PSEU|nr:hypothetical protein [Kibdelosporangium phytohabitans]ALG07367.1 hypothetical protein AOZ06_10925 [Kibdelosporangium phytohabitans]MBE1471756.1 uncharacterized protein YukE [Kibdelosporangium phytohabitans]